MSMLPVPLSGFVRAAEYVRVSTDHQKYSMANQQDAIRAFATRRDMKVVATYADEGRSGLDIDGRPSLRRLLADARSGALGCDLILVYDVTRWGRFQDPDEAAYYEFTCKQAGYPVVYCAEPFSEEKGPLARVLKGIKRAMAAEFSRELSVKTHAGQKRGAMLGCWTGGNVGYALRRAILDENGRPQLILEARQWKSVKSQRVGVVLGPETEVETVRRIFRLYVEEGSSMAQIAATLNAGEVPGYGGRPWKRGLVDRILKSERYVGTLVWGKSSTLLRGKMVHRAPEDWVRVGRALPAIVDAALFERAQKIVRQRQGSRFSTDELVAGAKRVHKRRGRLTSELLNAARDTPGINVYTRRFGSISRIYELVGCDPPKRAGYLDPEGIARRHRFLLAADVLRRLWAVGALVTADHSKHRLKVNGEFIIGLTTAIGHAGVGEERFRRFRFKEPTPEFVVIACIDPDVDRVRQYYVIPANVIVDLKSASRGESPFSAYRHQTLHGVERLANRELPLAEGEIA